ncbi:MAG: S8 family serine peptidase [Defluviitaleaceae bacterium]|nr:S8 family serine peptidase [Defluviitaleaceae bacterium]
MRSFEAGKVVVSLCKDYVCSHDMNDEDCVFYGMRRDGLEVIFPAARSGSHVGDVMLLNLACKKDETLASAVEQLRAHPNVIHAEPNILYGRHVRPNDPYYSNLWGLEKVNMPAAWDYTTGSDDVVVGVTDSGVDFSHPDIRENMRDSGWNFLNNNAQAMDMTGHGTHVAGTIGAVGNNFVGITGLNWRVKIANMRIGNIAMGLAAAIAAIEFANANGIEILNNSWGGRYYSPSLEHAIQHYNGLFVASAGNDGVDNDTLPDYPASFDCENIISVAATGPDDTLADFSNYGAVSTDIAAPGVDIFSLSLKGEYSSMSGTSMAAPHVAGAAALLKAYRPGLSALEIKRIILASADRLPGLSGKVLTGGRLNVKAMLEMAKSRQVHTIAPGENLWAIAKQFGVSLEDLIGANPQLAGGWTVLAGQVVDIP